MAVQALPATAEMAAFAFGHGEQMKYAIIENGIVANVAEAEADFAAEQGWVELTGGAGIGWTYEGGAFIAPPAQPEPVPETVSRFQARAALLQIGKLADAEAVVAQADAITQLAWSEAIEWKRSSPALNGLAEAIGLTQPEIDDLFRAAAEIEA